MADITDRQRVYAAAVVLARSEVRLGLPMDSGDGIRERCRRLLAASRGGALDVRSYRLAWLLTRGRA